MNHGERIYDRIEKMASFTETPGEITRPFGSESMQSMYRHIDDWAVADRLDFHIDQLNNIRLRSKKHDTNKKTFVVASHVDTVVNAGKYDGPLGFLIGYAMLLYSEQFDMPFNLEAIGFSDEEGVRFQTTYLGSSAVAGIFNNDWLNCTDKNKISLNQALKDVGRDPEKLIDCKIPKDNWLGYYEVHIEQGPILQNNNLAVGLVQNIYGQMRVEIDIIGFAGHAGTVPMNMRQDALVAFSEFNLDIEKYAIKYAKDLVATIGQCEVKPGASNVIPGHIKATIDIRSHDMNLLTEAASEIKSKLNLITNNRGLTYKWREVQRNLPVYCDQSLNELLSKSMIDIQNNRMHLSSGAGHDGVAISKVAPISMLFVRCKDGISHNPLEYSSKEDVDVAIQVSFSYLKRLIIKYS